MSVSVVARRRALAVACSVAGLSAVSASADPVRFFVDDNAAAGGDGAAWSSAFRTLQEALSVANVPGMDTLDVEILLAGGTYRASETGDRFRTLFVGGTDRDVTIRGGFAGLANPASPDENDASRYESIITADLAGNDVPNAVGTVSDNSRALFDVASTVSAITLAGLTMRGTVSSNGSGSSQIVNTIRAGCVVLDSVRAIDTGPIAFDVGSTTSTVSVFNCFVARDRFAANNSPGLRQFLVSRAANTLVDGLTYQGVNTVPGFNPLVQINGRVARVRNSTFAGGTIPAAVSATGDVAVLSGISLMNLLFSNGSAVSAGGNVAFVSEFSAVSTNRSTFVGGSVLSLNAQTSVLSGAVFAALAESATAVSATGSDFVSVARVHAMGSSARISVSGLGDAEVIDCVLEGVVPNLSVDVDAEIDVRRVEFHCPAVPDRGGFCSLYAERVLLSDSLLVSTGPGAISLGGSAPSEIVVQNTAFVDGSFTMVGPRAPVVTFRNEPLVTRIENCIFSGNGPAVPFIRDGSGGAPLILAVNNLSDQPLGAGLSPDAFFIEVNTRTEPPVFLRPLSQTPAGEFPDYRPAANSPVIDAGDSRALGAAPSLLDLAGNPRLVNVPGVADTGLPGPVVTLPGIDPPIVDIGPYEAPADLVVICPADFNGDTVPGDIFDLFDFLAALDGGLDFNGDTSPADIFDLFDFLSVLDQGCP